MDLRRARLAGPAIRLALFALAAALALAAAPVAAAAEASGGPETAASPRPLAPTFLPPRPDGFGVGAGAAVRSANADPRVREQLEQRGRLETRVEAKPHEGRWQVGYFDDGREVAVVFVDPDTATVRESWTGYQVAWQMARGYEGQFGHALNAPYVWLPLALVFLLGLFDFHRPRRLVHLDLLVALSFAISHLFFNRGEIGLSVPLALPPLIYLLARMLWIAWRGNRVGLRPSAPTAALALAAMLLIGFRIALNVADSGVIDVGYAGAIGADRITHGEPVYGTFPDDNPTGDTYGPASYLAYVPFEAALPWSGEWDELPASHAAAIFFDLATIAGLFVLGLRLAPAGAGRRLGTILVFAWCAYPYTAFALQANSNDALLAALLAWALALFASPLARGALLAAAALVKFAPLALVPLFAAGERGLVMRACARDGRAEPRRLSRLSPSRPRAQFALAFFAVAALLLAHPAIDPGLASFWERTLGSQLGRESPFSVWGQVAALGWLQWTVAAAAVLLAFGAAFFPRRRTLPQIAALAAAVLIAVQLAAEHWFYLYLPWFCPALFAALLAWRPAADQRDDAPAMQPVPARSP